jgi:mono/diheme cytochrome c family protein
MISARMSRPVRVLLLTCSVAVSALATACGSQKVNVSKSQPGVYHGAQLFSQRCSGCHTLSYAATHGSAANVRTKEPNNGPNFDIRCERPMSRVLYAIENGGFSGAIMPQNVVLGQDAIDVANFVATYAGRQAPPIPGVAPCNTKPVGTVPAVTTTTTPTSSATKASGAKSSKKAKSAARTAKQAQGRTPVATP